MSKHSLFLLLLPFSLLIACNADVETSESGSDSTSTLTHPDTHSISKNDTLKKFASEPGVLKMIRENYLDVMNKERSYLIITLVSGCNCGFVSFESIDINLKAFRSGAEAPGYWLLKGENEEYSSKIAEYYPKDVELKQPRRDFQEYGLFQSSTLIFEIRNNSQIVRCISFDRSK